MNARKNFTKNITTPFGNVNINVFLPIGNIFRRFLDNVSSETLLEFLEIPLETRNISIAIVTASFPAIRAVIQERRDQASNIANTLLTGTGSSFFAINAFSRENSRRLPAAVSYSIAVSNVSNTVRENFPSNPPLFLRGKNVVNSIEQSCHFFNITEGMFSSRGCLFVRAEDNSVNCSCNHTTVFAALLSVNNFEVPAEVRVRS